MFVRYIHTVVESFIHLYNAASEKKGRRNLPDILDAARTTKDATALTMLFVRSTTLHG